MDWNIMFDIEDSLYFEGWNRLKDLDIEFVRTNEFNGNSNKVVISSAGDYGVHYKDRIEVKSHTSTIRVIEDNAKFWFSTNMNSELINHDILPLGVANDETIKHINRNLGQPKDILLYCNFNPNTNRELRPGIKQIFQHMSYCLNKQYILDEHYFQHMACAKFVVCPEGNGIDTYRVWETLYSGGIPILQDSPFSRRVSQLFPALVMSDFEEIHKRFLIDKWEELKDKLIPERLNFSWWHNRIKMIIDECKCIDGKFGKFVNRIELKERGFGLRWLSPKKINIREWFNAKDLI